MKQEPFLENTWKLFLNKWYKINTFRYTDLESASTALNQFAKDALDALDALDARDALDALDAAW